MFKLGVKVLFVLPVREKDGSEGGVVSRIHTRSCGLGTCVVTVRRHALKKWEHLQCIAWRLRYGFVDSRKQDQKIPKTRPVWNIRHWRDGIMVPVQSSVSIQPPWVSFEQCL